MALSLSHALNRSSDGDDEVHLVIELVFEAVQPEATIADLMATAVPDTITTVEAAFDAEADRFFFVTFPSATSQGQERAAFEFARALRRETGALEANPVLIDNTYGAVGVGVAEESAVFFMQNGRGYIPAVWVGASANRYPRRMAP